MFRSIRLLVFFILLFYINTSLSTTVYNTQPDPNFIDFRVDSEHLIDLQNVMDTIYSACKQRIVGNADVVKMTAMEKKSAFLEIGITRENFSKLFRLFIPLSDGERIIEFGFDKDKDTDDFPVLKTCIEQSMRRCYIHHSDITNKGLYLAPNKEAAPEIKEALQKYHDHYMGLRKAYKRSRNMHGALSESGWSMSCRFDDLNGVRDQTATGFSLNRAEAFLRHDSGDSLNTRTSNDSH